MNFKNNKELESMGLESESNKEVVESDININEKIKDKDFNENIDNSNLVIETKRLSLVPISPLHRDDMFKEFTEEIATHMYPQPSGKIEDTDLFINTSIDSVKEGKDVQLVITSLDSDEFVGCAGLHDIDTKRPQLGIWIKSSAQGKGYGKESIIALKEWAENNLDYEYLKYPVKVENTASRKIAISLGGEPGPVYQGKNQNDELAEELEYKIYKSI